MSDALAKVLRRFEERLVKLESEAEARARHWKAVPPRPARTTRTSRAPDWRPETIIPEVTNG